MVVNNESVGLGPALRRAWVGYRLRLDAALAEAGFGDRGFPDGRVLRFCTQAERTIADIGRELRITRQGAGKVVTNLRERGYVTLAPSPADGREKIVTPTSKAIAYLSAQADAAAEIERQLRDQLGPEGFTALAALTDALTEDGQPRAADYLRGLRDRFGE